MPMYEYQCRKCTHEFETLVHANETVECPECHSQQLERLLSVPAKPPATSSMPMACNSSGPPCGPRCARY